MKYLRKFNESSQSAKDYKFRRDVLPYEIEDILLPLKDELLIYKVTFPTSDRKMIVLEIESNTTTHKDRIKDVLSHICNYLNSENFELSGYWTESESAEITTPNFNFEEFFELLPDYFSQMYLTFLFDRISQLVVYFPSFTEKNGSIWNDFQSTWTKMHFPESEMPDNNFKTWLQKRSQKYCL
jgi:hypothetical protein